MIPSNASLSVGGGEEGRTVKDLIDHVKAADTIGREIIDTQLHFLRSLDKLSLVEDDPINH